MKGVRMDLQGKRVAVVGGSSGIGMAVAVLSTTAGAQVTLISRSEPKLREAQASFATPPDVLPLDMLDEAAVNAAMAQLGPIDHLVLTAVADENARRKPYATLDTVTAQQTFGKFWGYFFLTRATAPYLQPGGSITLVSGASALKPAKSGTAMLAAVNGAVATLGRALAVELAPIRVNVVTPGAVDTPVWTADQRAGLVAWAEQALPVARLGQPDDIARSIVFLMTNPYATGVNLIVDGGLLLV